MLDDELAGTAERLGFKLEWVPCGALQACRSIRLTTPCVDHLKAASLIAQGIRTLIKCCCYIRRT